MDVWELLVWAIAGLVAGIFAWSVVRRALRSAIIFCCLGSLAGWSVATAYGGWSHTVHLPVSVVQPLTWSDLVAVVAAIAAGIVWVFVEWISGNGDDCNEPEAATVVLALIIAWWATMRAHYGISEVLLPHAATALFGWLIAGWSAYAWWQRTHPRARLMSQLEDTATPPTTAAPAADQQPSEGTDCIRRATSDATATIEQRDQQIRQLESRVESLARTGTAKDERIRELEEALTELRSSLTPRSSAPALDPVVLARVVGYGRSALVPILVLNATTALAGVVLTTAAVGPTDWRVVEPLLQQWFGLADIPAAQPAPAIAMDGVELGLIGAAQDTPATRLECPNCYVPLLLVDGALSLAPDRTILEPSQNPDPADNRLLRLLSGKQGDQSRTVRRGRARRPRHGGPHNNDNNNPPAS